MSKVRLTVEVESEAKAEVEIGGREVKIHNNGKGYRSVEPGEEKLLDFVFVGKGGDKYEITLDPPSGYEVKATEGKHPVKSKIPSSRLRGSGFMKFVVEATSLVVLLFGAQPVASQSPARNAGPPSPSVLATPQATIEAGESNKRAQLVVGFGQGTSLTASVPLDEDDGVSDFTTLDGLADDFALKLKGLFGMDAGMLRRPAHTRREICTRHGVPAGDTCTDGAIETALQGRGADPATIGAAIDEFDRASVRKVTWLAGYSVGLGYKSFDFFDQSARADTVDRVSLSAGVDLAAVYGRGLWALSVSGERAYEDQKEAQRCEAVSGQPEFERCTVLPVGEPATPDWDPTVRTAVRHIFGAWAIGPELTFKRSSGDWKWGVDVPIYLVPDASGALVAGFRVGYASEAKRVRGSVFLSKPISAF